MCVATNTLVDSASANDVHIHGTHVFPGIRDLVFRMIECRELVEPLQNGVAMFFFMSSPSPSPGWAPVVVLVSIVCHEVAIEWSIL